MRRLLSLVLIAVLLFPLCACEKKDSRVVEGSFVFTKSNFPKIAVTNANFHYAEAIVTTTLGCDKTEALEHIVKVDYPDEAYELLIKGECSVAIAHQPSSLTSGYFEGIGNLFIKREIAKDALIFVCNKNNPVSDLTSDQLKMIYNSTVTDWGTLLGTDGQGIKVFVPDEKSATGIILSAKLGQIAVDNHSEKVETVGGAYVSKGRYDNSPEAIGAMLYSDIFMGYTSKNGASKLLAVDSVESDETTLLQGSYPFTCGIYVAINKKSLETDPDMILYNWLASSQGKQVIKAAGGIIAETLES